MQRLQIQLINNTPAKNKVFFAESFGVAPFYFYIFIRRLMLGWEGSWSLQEVLPVLDVFHRGEKLFVTADFTGQDGRCRPVFLVPTL